MWSNKKQKTPFWKKTMSFCELRLKTNIDTTKSWRWLSNSQQKQGTNLLVEIRMRLKEWLETSLRSPKRRFEWDQENIFPKVLTTHRQISTLKLLLKTFSMTCWCRRNLMMRLSSWWPSIMNIMILISQGRLSFWSSKFKNAKKMVEGNERSIQTMFLTNPSSKTSFLIV